MLKIKGWVWSKAVSLRKKFSKIREKYGHGTKKGQVAAYLSFFRKG